MHNPMEVAQSYFNAWNAHDSGSIADLFIENGEYSDPNIKIRGREITDRGRDTIKELLKMEGFIGAASARAGERSITVTAWNRPEDVSEILQSQAHNNAKKRFWDDLGDAAYFNVWVPHHINPMWGRCRECKKMSSYEKSNGLCSCGSKLPDLPPYF